MTRPIRTESRACTVIHLGSTEPYPPPAELRFYTTLLDICQIAIPDREKRALRGLFVMADGDLTRFDFCGTLSAVTDKGTNEMKHNCEIAINNLEPRPREKPVDPFG